MAESILKAAQPSTATWGDAPNAKLTWLSMFYGIKPDRIAAEAEVSRSQLYHFMAGTRNMSDELKSRIASTIGFPDDAWDWTLDQFDQWIRQNYPGFAANFTDPTNTAA